MYDADMLSDHANDVEEDEDVDDDIDDGGNNSLLDECGRFSENDAIESSNDSR